MMSDDSRAAVHKSFWVIGAFALVWNGLGSVNYLIQVTAESLDAYRAVEQAIIADRPAWATGAFAVGVFGGTVGAVLLLLGKSVAFHVFIVSLIGVVVFTVHTLSLGLDFGIGEMVVIVAMPTVVGLLFAWYAKYAEGKGWVS
ncbi:MAG: hypothetical protein ACPHGY_04680 [Rhodospirillaceae bacterium]|jgi:hypothetical protein